MNYECMRVKLLQLCPTLWDSMDCVPPASSVHGILQARKLEWVAIPALQADSLPSEPPRKPNKDNTDL